MKIYKHNIQDVPGVKVINGRINGVISVGLDGMGYPAVYVAERDTGEIIEVEIEVVWTGGEAPVDKVFLGTVLTRSALVLHVFYKPLNLDIIGYPAPIEIVTTDQARELMHSSNN